MAITSMKNTSGTFFLLTICLIGLAGMMRSDAQSIVGKWKQVSGKMYCTADAVKNSHGHLQEVMEMPKADVVDEFKSDHTLTETITTGQTKTSNSGTWTMTGNSVTISITGHPPMGGIVSGTDNTLIYTIEMPKSEHMQVIKRQWTYSKV
ncbi:MAG TPA: lipocalin family protein [Puia sp.]|nr:lipocalin family protein [Puia sp.]